MSTGGEIVFVVCALFAVVCAVLTITLRSPLRAAMGLLGNILSLAGLYLSLQAHLLAAIQLMVYAGAIVVLFVFVIMLIGPSAEPKTDTQKGLLIRTAGGAMLALVGGAIVFQVASVTPAAYVDIDQCVRPGVVECDQFGGVNALGQAIFSDAAVPFELLSVLLLVAIIAAVAVARGHHAHEKRALEQREDGAGDAPSDAESGAE